MKCPKCGGEMEEGYELFPTYGGYWPKVWTTDLTRKNVLGIKGLLGYEGKNGNPVKAHRCKTCGYLESYAK